MLGQNCKPEPAALPFIRYGEKRFPVLFGEPSVSYGILYFFRESQKTERIGDGRLRFPDLPR